MKSLALAAFAALLLATGVAAQDIIPLEKAVRNQRGTVSQKIANTDLTIE